MHKKLKFNGKVFVTYVAISFLFASIFVLIVFFGLNNKIVRLTALINTFAVERNDKELVAKFDDVKKRLTSYPAYGTKYANIKIDAIDLSLPVYYGDNLEILSHGIGHYAGSYFPGEGGTIILAGHNNSGYFDKILNLKKNDSIAVETGYGTFEYRVDNTNIVSEHDLSAFPIQSEKEMLILYTCYPLGVGHKTQRYVVYAYRAGDMNE